MDKDKLIHDSTEKIQDIIHELENNIGEKIINSQIYNGDIIVDGEETEGTKITISTEVGEFDPNNELEPVEYQSTVQDILIEYHNKETNIKNLADLVTGLDHIQDKYYEIIKLEKEEARKALGEENKEYFKYL